VDQIRDIRDAIGAGPDLICDGGVRRGSDVVKALALGATACSIGRPYLYGLAAGGEAGVHRILSILIDEFERTMILAGINDVERLGRRHVRRRNA
jgi:L-lactate dehydrogenase (cytochrome)